MWLLIHAGIKVNPYVSRKGPRMALVLETLTENKDSFIQYIVNTMGADDLATEGTRVSAATVLTQIFWKYSVHSTLFAELYNYWGECLSSIFVIFNPLNFQA